MPAGGHCPSCSAETFADEAASASTHPIPGPPPRGLGENAFRVAPGQRFGDRFTLVEEIGAGGMGQVYKAIDVSLGKTVALKLVRARSGPQEQTMERFRRELTLAREVTHPNVCRVYDLGEIDGTLFISMEYVEGQSLDDLIQSVGTLSTKQTIAIARQICAGLEAIHSRKIVHRDLKPANIMVDRAGHAILMDFGLAYAARPATGSPAKAPSWARWPTSLRSRRVGQATDARTDIYAIGLDPVRDADRAARARRRRHGAPRPARLRRALSRRRAASSPTSPRSWTDRPPLPRARPRAPLRLEPSSWRPRWPGWPPACRRA